MPKQTTPKEQSSANEEEEVADVQPAANLEPKENLRGAVLIVTALNGVQASTQPGSKQGDTYSVWEGHVQGEERTFLFAGGVVLDRQLRLAGNVPDAPPLPFAFPKPVRGKLVQPPRKRYWALEPVG